MSTTDLSWGKDGQCVRLTTYHPCSAETSRKSGALIYPEPLGPPRRVAGDLYFAFTFYCLCFNLFCNVCVCGGGCVFWQYVYLYLLCFVLFVLCFFVLSLLCIFILICFVCTSVRTTATE